MVSLHTRQQKLITNSFGLTAINAAPKSDRSSTAATDNSTWAHVNNNTTTTTTPKDTPESHPDGQSAALLAPIVSDIERERLRLITHYIRYTAQSITDFGVQSGDPSLWRDWVPELAFEHDFLLHGVLGLSALHLALQYEDSNSNDQSKQKQRYTVLAIQHYDRGIALFRPHLADLKADNQDVIFAFAVIVALYSFGIQRASPSRDSSNGIARLHQALCLIRSSSHIAKSEVTSKPCAVDAIEDMLATLAQYTSKMVTDSTQQEMYMFCIEQLRINFALAVAYDHSQGRLSYFAVTTPAEFWSAVCIGDPPALAILANYAVVLHWLKDTIWLRGWGKETVDGVRDVLPIEWHECIAWAVREAEIE